jgi:uncharacterized membrane protein (DUF485 family)
MPNGNRDRARSGADLFATGVVAVAYFAYMIACVDRPRLFAKPVFAGGILPWGIVGGVALVVLIMAMAALYMVLRNRSDRREGAE